MTTIDTRTLCVADTALILRARLGPMRSWTNFLTDCIRDRQAIAGQRLMPCGRQHDGKAYRPTYATSDILNFIAKVLAAVPTAGRATIKTKTLPIDTSKHWRLNKFDKNGAPVATLCGYNLQKRVGSFCSSIVSHN